VQPPRPADLEGRLIANSVHARLFPGDERPTRIGNYVIIRRIGGGAMGDVFLAHHESLDRQAAIKLVRPAAEDSTIERQRLLREATILAKIDHPHVIGVHDSGTHDNRVYLAMEYVKGTTLGVWQKGRPWRELLAVYLKAGRGLQAVHAVVLDADERNATGTTRRCLCHRDFKPDNVLISDHGDVRVADFGLAVPTQRRDPGQGGRAIDLRLTADASVVGTPLYISPEQLGGSPGDARSDQYSFCVALYEALYDQHPYYAPAPAVRDSELATDSGGPGGTHPQFALFEAILGAPLRPAPRSKVPRRIHTILARGLQRDPAARYPSMAALLAALEHDPKRRPLQAFAGIAVIGTAFGVGMASPPRSRRCAATSNGRPRACGTTPAAQVKAAFVDRRELCGKQLRGCRQKHPQLSDPLDRHAGKPPAMPRI
jgi:serine/threonine protein kinase